jgi:hypothetical protein
MASVKRDLPVTRMYAPITVWPWLQMQRVPGAACCLHCIVQGQSTVCGFALSDALDEKDAGGS